MSSVAVSEAYNPRAMLVEHVRATSATSGGRVLVRGESGLGKSHLLADALKGAEEDGTRLLFTRASDWTSKLSLSGLIDLFGNVPSRELDVLEPAQRDAVEIALSRRMPTHPVLPLTLRVAVTSVIVGLLRYGPVAIIVDDWSLLDEETAAILTWVFTRPGRASRAALVATERAGGGSFRFTATAAAQELFRPEDTWRLPALEAWECETLLRNNFGDRLSRLELTSIVRLARGNPHWALEIAHDRAEPPVVTATSGLADETAAGVLDILKVKSMPPPALDRVLPLHIDALLAGQGESGVTAFLARLRSEVGGQQPQAAMAQAYRAQLRSHPISQRKQEAENALSILGSRTDVPATLHGVLGALVRLKVDLGEGLDAGLLDRLGELERSIDPVALTRSVVALRAFHAFEVDDHEASLSALEELIGRAKGAGQDPLARFFGVHLATTLIETGDVARARDLLVRFDEGDPGPEVRACIVLRARGLLALADGDRDALTALFESDGSAGSTPDDPSLRIGLEGLFAARSEQWARAVPLLQKAIDIAEEAGVLEPGRRMWCDIELGEALVALGRLDEASLIAERMDGIADQRNRPLTRARCLRLRGLLRAAVNDLAGAEDLFRSALDLVGADGGVCERARLLLQLGRVLRRRRARARARDHFERALQIAEGVGDRLLEARIRREIDRLGESTQIGDLTASEARVAEAVLSGASNSDVAAAQFVSIRTVEAHLSAIYRKWGLRSRIQLVAELHRRGGQQN